MFCGYCGNPLRSGARFCVECGKPAPERSPAEDTPLARTTRPTPAASPLPPRQPALTLPPRKPWGRTARLLLALALALPLAVGGGWAAHFLPQSAAGNVQAVGELEADASDPQASPSPADAASGSTGDDATADPATSFVTSCGKVLDVVPTGAVAYELSVQVTMEFHPVCPQGEWISSGQLRVSLADTTGATLALGSFDFSDQPLLIPGFSDPTSVLIADFGPGTAWSAPETLARDIIDGTVVVACRTLDGATGESLAAGETVQSATMSARATSVEPEDIDETALGALRRQAAADDYSVSLLEGSWIPQLSSKKAGTYDDHDGKVYSLADIYQQFLELRLRYPNVRVLSSTDWNSYTLDGYWVVIAGVPFIGPNQSNTWCGERGIAPSQCFAKRLIRDGAPEGTTKHRR